MLIAVLLANRSDLRIPASVENSIFAFASASGVLQVAALNIALECLSSVSLGTREPMLFPVTFVVASLRRGQDLVLG